MELLYGTVKSIVVYFILSTVVMNLLGKSEFKKYIGIFMGMILILIVIQPLLKLSKMDDYVDYYFKINEIETDKTMEEKFKKAQKKQDESMIEQYKETIFQQTKWLLDPYGFQIQRFQLEMEEDMKEKDFGKIYNISLTILGINQQDKKEAQKEKIQKIQIDQINIGEEKEEERKKETTKASAEITNLIAQFYHLEKEQVSVAVINEEPEIEGD